MQDMNIPEQPLIKIRPRTDQAPDLVKVEENIEPPTIHFAPGRENRGMFDFRAKLLLEQQVDGSI